MARPKPLPKRPNASGTKIRTKGGKRMTGYDLANEVFRNIGLNENHEISLNDTIRVISFWGFNEEAIRIKSQQIYANSDTKDLFSKRMQDLFNELYREFMVNNKRDTISANVAMAEHLSIFLEDSAKMLEKTGLVTEPNIIRTDALEIFTGSTFGVFSRVYKYSAQEYMKNGKRQINKLMRDYTKGLTDEEMKDFRKQVIDHLAKISKEGNFILLSNSEVRKRGEERLPKLYKNIMNNKSARNNLTTFLKDYEALYRYGIKDIDKKASKDINIIKTLQLIQNKKYFIESIIDDLLANN